MGILTISCVFFLSAMAKKSLRSSSTLAFPISSGFFFLPMKLWDTFFEFSLLTFHLSFAHSPHSNFGGEKKIKIFRMKETGMLPVPSKMQNRKKKFRESTPEFHFEFRIVQSPISQDSFRISFNHQENNEAEQRKRRILLVFHGTENTELANRILKIVLSTDQFPVKNHPQTF